MLKVIHTGNGLPISYPVDPTAEFQGGMIAQLKLIGNDIVSGISDGTAPIGLIDDVRTSAFTKPQNDEIVEINLPSSSIEVDDNGNRVSTVDSVGYLEFPNVVTESFISDIAINLNDVNGVIIVLAGTELNYDSDEDGINDSFKVIVSYIYRIANKPGDDSTIGSGRVTVHYAKGFYATDQYDIRQIYPLNATLFVGLDGKLTTKRPSDEHPGVAFVTGPPSAANGTLEFFWL